jgi:uncharacterized protein YjbI with pentapeptide repeats
MGSHLTSSRKALFYAATLALATARAIANESVSAQDLLRHLDLTSPEMTQADITRLEIEVLISRGHAHLTGSKLSGLDLSGINLAGAMLRSAPRCKAHYLSGNLCD